MTILIWNSCFCQTHFIGQHERQDSKILFNADTTFKFSYSVDTYRGWTKGTWSVKNNKIYLTPIPVYDTISLTDISGSIRDSLTLSKDEIPSRINNQGKRTINVFQVEQNPGLCPTKLLNKGDKLIIIKNGKRRTKKINNGYYIDAFDPWYKKTKVSN